MLTLYCYPKLFGLTDNNPFGLKVDTYLRLNNIPFQLNNILDTSSAPRNQLPYIEYDQTTISDSSHIIAYLDKNLEVGMDAVLSQEQKQTAYLIESLLGNHLYWVIAYSRWSDERYFPDFKKAFLSSVSQLSEADIDNIRAYNLKKHQSQGIGRYDRDEVYQSGIDDLDILSQMLANNHYLFGQDIHSIDASCYGFLANIYYASMDTELKSYMCQSNLKPYIERIRAQLDY